MTFTSLLLRGGGSFKAIRLRDEWRLATVGKRPSASELLFAMETRRGFKKSDLLKLIINDVDTFLVVPAL